MFPFMKALIAIIILAVIAYFFLRSGSKHREPDQAAVVQSSPTPAGTNYFKRPLDRTHEVIDQVKKQRREDNY